MSRSRWLVRGLLLFVLAFANLNDIRPEATSCEGEESAAASNVEKTASGERFDPQHRTERPLRLRDPLLVEHLEKPAPVVTELEPLAARDLLAMR